MTFPAKVALDTTNLIIDENKERKYSRQREGRFMNADVAGHGAHWPNRSETAASVERRIERTGLLRRG